jgi:hypothetical protein
VSKGARVGLSVVGVLTAPFVLAILTGTQLLILLRDELRYNCGFYQGGGSELGSWVCADGIGYLMPGAFVFGCLGLLALVAAAKAAHLAERPHVRRRVLTLLALAPLALLVLTTIGVRPQASEPGVDLWAQHMAVATWLVAASAVAIVAAAAAPRAVMVPFVLVALALLTATTIAQDGTLYGTLPAALLLAWAWWADHRSHRQRSQLTVGSAA